MDRKTRFFKNAVILQFIPLFLLGLLIFSNFREQKILKIRELHPYEFNYGELLPLIFFAVCCIVALFTLFPKTPDAAEDEEEVIRRKRKQNFWKFAFYCNVFLLFVIGMFSVLVFQKDALIIDQPVHFYAIIFSRFLLVIIISLVVASFLLAAGIYWKTNKSLAVVILTFGFLILTVSSVFELVFVSVFVENSERHFIAKAQKQTGNQEEIYEDYATEGNAAKESKESDYEENEEESSVLSNSMITGAWNSFMENFYVKKEGLSYDFLGLRQYVHSIFDGQLFDNEYRVIANIDDVKEHSELLKEALQSYKAVLYATVSTETYRNNHFDEVVDKLLLVYDDVGTDREKLNRIYEIMRYGSNPQGNDGNISMYLPDIKKYCSSNTLKKLSDDKGFCKYKSDVVWFYSFWARRNNEGNLKEVALILKEIKEHYENSEE